MIQLHALKKHPKSTRRKKVVGRGLGSGHGTYSTRGGKGQTARTGHSKMPAGFEGGRQPLIRQLPKSRGFRGLAPKPAAVSLTKLSVYSDGDTVSLATLKAKGLVAKDASRVKLLAGTVNRKLEVRVPVSAEAKKAVLAAGGSVKN